MLCRTDGFGSESAGPDGGAPAFGFDPGDEAGRRPDAGGGGTGIRPIDGDDAAGGRTPGCDGLATGMRPED